MTSLDSLWVILLCIHVSSHCIKDLVKSKCLRLSMCYRLEVVFRPVCHRSPSSSCLNGRDLVMTLTTNNKDYMYYMHYMYNMSELKSRLVRAGFMNYTKLIENTLEHSRCRSSFVPLTFSHVRPSAQCLWWNNTFLGKLQWNMKWFSWMKWHAAHFLLHCPFERWMHIMMSLCGILNV